MFCALQTLLKSFATYLNRYLLLENYPAFERTQISSEMLTIFWFMTYFIVASTNYVSRANSDVNLAESEINIG